jgi:hypothetical protein
LILLVTLKKLVNDIQNYFRAANGKKEYTA